LLHQRFQRRGLWHCGTMAVSSKLSWIKVNQEIYRQWSLAAACVDAPIRA
jgi:hypothetical protein